jgi:hypothetical protein
MKSSVYHGGKPEVRHHLVETTDEAALLSDTDWDALHSGDERAI